MAWLNEEVAGLLREYAELTQITGGDVFRARNYEKAARSVRGWADDVSHLDAKGLRAIPGVGASIAAKIAEYLATGHIAALDELRAQIPAGVLELTKVPGLGPKRALQLNHDLGVSSVDELAAAVQAGWRSWPGSGPAAKNASPAASRCTGRAASGSCSTWPCTPRPPWSRPCPPSPAASAVPMRARCGGGGRPSATSTSWPPPTNRPH